MQATRWTKTHAIPDRRGPRLLVPSPASRRPWGNKGATEPRAVGVVAVTRRLDRPGALSSKRLGLPPDPPTEGGRWKLCRARPRLRRNDRDAEHARGGTVGAPGRVVALRLRALDQRFLDALQLIEARRQLGGARCLLFLRQRTFRRRQRERPRRAKRRPSLQAAPTRSCTQDRRGLRKSRPPGSKN